MMKRKQIIRNDKYLIQAFRICPVEFINSGELDLIRILFDGYGYRIGVLDKANSKVIDIDMMCSYDYIETRSYGGFKKNSNIQAKTGNRYANGEVYVSYSELTDDDINRINYIIERLESDDCYFLNGNDVYSNEDYLKEIDKITLKKELNKIDDSKVLLKNKCQKI